MPLYDLQVSRNGTLQTDLVTGSLNRVINRTIECEDRGELCRVVDQFGNILPPEHFRHDYRAKGRLRRSWRNYRANKK